MQTEGMAAAIAEMADMFGGGDEPLDGVEKEARLQLGHRACESGRGV